MNTRFVFYCTLIVLGSFFSSCREGFSKRDRVLIIQPFGDFPEVQYKTFFRQIKAIHAKTIMRPPIELPSSAFNAKRGRYRAEILLQFLNTSGSADSVVIGLTGKDICTTKGDVADWGIMGLAYRPGNACVASSFRLDKRKLSKQFFKVAIHELGHTQGLPHCPQMTCFMRDAEGGNPIDSETGFCAGCTSFLKRKGWRLN